MKELVAQCDPCQQRSHPSNRHAECAVCSPDRIIPVVEISLELNTEHIDRWNPVHPFDVGLQAMACRTAAADSAVLDHFLCVLWI